ncbi:hypothetical protein GCM10007205_14280 [Oxalicibacterium flavum]|uniref:Uncharacterized protein n=1 Tax=Oxalicibacterium flavum TaxID=179467 RepID=A0A8J2XX66_9BURK|nr:hypothetical protein GCM10007205_14280 [Oxalicibacterium flavum]
MGGNHAIPARGPRRFRADAASGMVVDAAAAQAGMQCRCVSDAMEAQCGGGACRNFVGARKAAGAHHGRYSGSGQARGLNVFDRRVRLARHPDAARLFFSGCTCCGGRSGFDIHFLL